MRAATLGCGLAGACARLALQSSGSAPPSALAEASKFLGNAATNNVAEFAGLVLGLDLACIFMRQEEPSAGSILVTVVGDSQLVIDVMRQAVCNNEQLIVLFDQAHNRVEDLERVGCCVDFQQRRRAHNLEADSLANKAMDACRLGDP